MPLCLIGLGSNLGDRRQALDRAVARLAEHPQLRVVGKSTWCETSPVGGPVGQSPYLNGAATVETSLPPPAVLDILQGIEGEMGRKRSRRWSARRIDLDLLLYDRLVLESDRLVVPHPRMAWRRFVLRPAAEIAGAMVHPLTGWSVSRLLEHLDETRPYVAITGSIGAGKTHLAERLARRVSARLLIEPLDLQRLHAFYADPASQAWETEIEFLRRRAGWLAADSPHWSEDAGPTVSDFWFDQSPAFARVWLPAERQAPFRRLWQEARPGVARPRLIVFLDLPGEELLKRTRLRGRHFEQGLSAERLAEIGREIAAETAEPDQGPVLRLGLEKPDRQLDEVAAAVKAWGT